MGSSAEIQAKLKKDYGETTVVGGGDKYKDQPRLPSGIFAFDLATGGGFPMGRPSIVYGPESSGKTNLVLSAIGAGQVKFPDKKAVFIDAESSYDPIWSQKLGVRIKDLIVCHPEYAEQAVDMIEAFMYADDVFCVVLDSMAALTTQNEIESDAGKMIVGGASLLVGKLMKKVNASFTKMSNMDEVPPAFIAVNQIRHKIGVMFGDNETMPGGNAPRYTSALTVRVYGKNEMEKKIHPVMPAYKKTSMIIKKWKVPILAMTSEYLMQMVDGGGRGAGHVEDWNTVSNYLKELDYLSKADKNKGWVLMGETYPTLIECRNALYEDQELLQEVKETIIRELMETKALAAEEEDG